MDPELPVAMPSGPFRHVGLSKAARTHRLRKLRTPAKCRECNSYVYFQGAECEEVCGSPGPGRHQGSGLGLALRVQTSRLWLQCQSHPWLQSNLGYMRPRLRKIKMADSKGQGEVLGLTGQGSSRAKIVEVGPGIYSGCLEK